MLRQGRAKFIGCFVGVASALLSVASVPASGKEGVMEWRFVKNEGQVDLHIADTDGSADTIGTPSFKFEKGDKPTSFTKLAGVGRGELFRL